MIPDRAVICKTVFVNMRNTVKLACQTTINIPALDIAACYTGVIGVLKLLEQNNPAIEMLSKLGIMEKVAGGNLEEANKDWKQMQVRYPHIEVDE